MSGQYWLKRSTNAAPDFRRYVARELLARRDHPSRDDPKALGHVVEFLKSGKAMCGVLTGRRRRTWRVLGADGTEDHIDSSKIVTVGATFVDPSLRRGEILGMLRAIDREREQLKQALDPYELWEVVQPEGAKWRLGELTDLYFPGTVGPHDEAALFRALEACGAFTRQGESFFAVSPAKAAAARQQEQHALRAEAWLADAAAWVWRAMQDKLAPPPPDAERALDLLAAKVLFGGDHPQAPMAADLAKRAGLRSPEAVFDALVKLGHWGEDENLDLLRHEIPTRFAQATLAEADESSRLWNRRARRRPWFRRVYSFPGSGAHVGCAFSIRRGLFGGWLVGVHLASPSLAMRQGGLVQEAARERAQEIALPDRRIPMLPEAILKKASLTPGRSTPALTLQLRFDSRLRLRQSHFEVCLTRTAAPLSTGDVTKALKTDTHLQALHGIAQRLRRRRLAAGALIMPEPRVEVRARDGVTSLQRSDPLSPSRVIEGELCLVANALAGRLCQHNGLPALYRASSPCPEVLVDPDAFDAASCYRQRRSMPRARLQTMPEPHHGDGVDVCASIDRPLARYSDLLMHQQIISFLLGDGPVYTEGDLRDALSRTAYARDVVRQIVSNARRYWLHRHLEGQVGQVLNAVVLQPLREGSRVELTQTRLWAFCGTRRPTTLPPGTSIKVRLLAANARADLIRLELVEPR